MCTTVVEYLLIIILTYFQYTNSSYYDFSGNADIQNNEMFTDPTYKNNLASYRLTEYIENGSVNADHN